MKPHTEMMTDPDPLFDAVERALSAYKDEGGDDHSHADAELVDVYVVGSAVTDEFEPGRSDVDLCVLLDGVDAEVPIGFDTFLRECRQRELLDAAIDGATEVDVGTYRVDVREERIADAEAYSCRTRRVLTIGEESHLA